MGATWYKRGANLAVGLIGVVLLAVSLFFALQKPVAIAVDGTLIKDRVLFNSTVAGVLEKNDIILGEHDLIEPGLSAVVEKNSMITITRAFTVYIIADGQKKEIIAPPLSIKEAIAQAGINLGDKDLIKTLPVEQTQPQQEIEVIRVTEQETRLDAPLPYGEERTEDGTLEKGLTRTLRRGVNGVVTNTIKITYHNGQEVKREIIDSQTKVPSVNKIVAVGNITTVSRGSLRLTFKEAMYARTTAYTYTGHHTATGLDPAVGLVAVDPVVIPLGSRLYIEGYGYATASDTGGSVHGNTIDLFMEDRGQCLKWGVKNVKVYVLE